MGIESKDTVKGDVELGECRGRFSVNCICLPLARNEFRGVPSAA